MNIDKVCFALLDQNLTDMISRNLPLLIHEPLPALNQFRQGF